MVRFVYLLGILSWLLAAYGFLKFLQLNFWYALLFGPIILVLTIYYLISYGINLFYRRFDVREHHRKVRAYWGGQKQNPKVDIYLPICGEDIKMLTKTWKGVSRLKYINRQVYVLDDKGDKQARELAVKFGFIYLSRPNRGFMKKSGNLKHAVESSRNDFFIIFDADFVPKPRFIHELLPYMSDPRVAIVQSPQFFETSKQVHRRSPLEYGAGHVQEDFYRIIQPSRDRFGAAICVGSNAIYRRAAIDAVGGTAQIEHSEDVHTGFKLIKAGYKIKYVPLLLAIGLCPDKLEAYFKQQNRWCSGSMSLIFSREFWSSKLSIPQKICYVSGLMYYITHVLALLMPLQALAVLYFHYQQIGLEHSLPFLPYFAYAFILLPLFRATKTRHGTYLATMAFTYSYFYAVLSNIVKRPLAWVPTNAVKSTISPEFRLLSRFSVLYLSMYTGMVLTLIALGRFPIFDTRYLLLTSIIGYNLLVQMLFVVNTLRFTRNSTARSSKRQFPSPLSAPLMFQHSAEVE